VGKVYLRRSGARQFVGTDERKQTLVVDAMPKGGGEGEGLKPSELVPFAVGACIGVTAISILEKQRLEPYDLSLEVDFEHAEEKPHRFSRFVLNWHFRGPKITAEKAQKALEMSHERYCSVAATLKDDVVIEQRVTVEKT
jgi:putative redox protein